MTANGSQLPAGNSSQIGPILPLRLALSSRRRLVTGLTGITPVVVIGEQVDAV
jgi:hypothetical protein